MYKASFNTRSKVFYSTLIKEVNRHFEEKGIAKTGDGRLYAKTVIFLGLAVYLYIQLVFFTPVWFLAIPLCMLSGLVAAGIGFNIMHDACHGSYSPKGWVNDLMGYSLNLLGSISFFWKLKHNVIHHTFTNIEGIDSDIAQSSLLRFCPAQPKRTIHRYQHLYSGVLYAFSAFVWVFVNDFDKYFNRRILLTPIKNVTWREHLIFWVTKAAYVSLYLVIPMIAVGVIPTLIGYFIYMTTLGFVLAIVFQLAHVVEIVEFEDATKEPLEIAHEWAIHQMRTTADFATNNKMVSWFLGGLNFQIEHHLFPRVSHIHYADIQKIVQRVSSQCNVAYRSFPTMTEAIASHYRTLRALGQNNS